MKKIPFVLAVWLLVSGCVTGSHVVTSESRPSLAPDAVKIYAAAPANSVPVGLVSATSTASFSWQKAKDQAVQKLKIEAGKIGANGIVLTSSAEDAWNGATAQAQAIYVAPQQ